MTRKIKFVNAPYISTLAFVSERSAITSVTFFAFRPVRSFEAHVTGNTVRTPESGKSGPSGLPLFTFANASLCWDAAFAFGLCKEINHSTSLIKDEVSENLTNTHQTCIEAYVSGTDTGTPFQRVLLVQTFEPVLTASPRTPMCTKCAENCGKVD